MIALSTDDEPLALSTLALSATAPARPRRYWLLLLLWLALCLLASTGLAQTTSRRPLVVGSEQDFPPFATGLTDATAGGFTVELWREVAREAGIDFVIRVRPFNEILEGFKTGEIDVLINLAQSDERRAFADFSTPHVTSWGAIFVREGESGIRSEKDLAGRRIIVLAADLAEDYAISRGWKPQLVPVATSAEGLRLLASGQHDAMLLSKLVGLKTLRDLGIDGVTVAEGKAGFAQKFSFAVPKGQADLLARINDSLAVTRSDGRYEAIYDRWFGPYESVHFGRGEILIYVGPPAALLLLVSIYLVYRRQIDAAQRASSERLRLVLDSSNDAFVGMDAAGRINAWNRQAEAMFGWPRALAIGRSLAETIIPEASRAAHVSGLQRFLATREGPILNQRIEVDGLRRDGEQIPIELGIWPVWTGTEVSFGAFMRDITERRRARSELLALNASLEARVQERTVELEQAKNQAEAANRAKSEFLAVMSHEIRTPMNGVVGMAEVLRQAKLDADAADAVATIRESAFSLLQIIDDILDFSKIEAGRVELTFSPIYLVDFVEATCRALETLANDRGVDLSLMLDPQLPEAIRTDPDRLRRILTNLLGNAIKFSGGRPQLRGRVDLRVSIDSATPLRLSFAVSDNGIGMSQDTISHLFTPFTQAEASTTRRFGGTGLGLVICNRLATLFDGEISVASTPDFGSRFTLTLPIETCRDLPPRPSQDLTGIDCILLRGPDVNAEDLAAYLQPAGAKITIADSLDTAVAVAARSPCAVVVHARGHFEVNVGALLRSFSPGASTAGHVVLLRGDRRMARHSAPGVLSLDANVLSRRRLLRAVAEAAGRQPAEQATGPAKSPDEPRPVAAPSIEAARASGRLVLVAEDDEINQKVVLRQLGLLGYAAEVADNGAEALQLWRKRHHPLLITDLHMPELDGYGLTAAIRAEAPDSARMPIIALTANALHGEADRARSAGMNAFLTKPIQLDALRAALQQWFPLAESPAIRPTAEPVAAPDSAAASQAEPPFDVAVLRAYIGDVDADVVGDFMASYRDNLLAQRDELRTALSREDWVRIGRIAHRLKSSSHSVGARDVAEVCERLEIAGHCGDAGAVRQGMVRFESAADALLLAVKDLLDKANP